MRNLNRVILSGNAVADVDTRCTPGGKSIVILRLATNEYWYKGEEKRQTVEYHRVVFFEPYFESAKDITKGMAVYLEGKNKTRKYTGADDMVRRTTCAKK
ncbi:MAG: single-stranded DNA-binding protein [Gammaproteobacteria bacterium]